MSRVVLLGQDGFSTRVCYAALRERFPDVQVMVEEPVPRTRMLQRRLHTLGALTVLGQILFMAVALPVLRVLARQRIAELQRDPALRAAELPADAPYVASVNTPETRAALRELNPSVVVVSGTRIISADTLASVSARFINMHAGITPLYRGVHGGYWAVAEGRPDLAGTTVHLVDRGIDTGTILAQVQIQVSPRDSYVTYPYMQLAAGLPLLLNAVSDALRDELKPMAVKPALASKLRSHPTLWGYLARRLLRNAR